MLNQLVDAWHSGVTGFSVYMLRSMFLPLLVYNIYWSFKGCVRFLQHRALVMSLFNSMIFFMSMGMVIRNSIFFVNYPATETGPMALMALCFMVLATILATVTHHYNLAAKMSTFYWLVSHENANVAVRAAELAKFDPEYMRGVLDNAETTIAVRLAQRVRGS